MTSLPGRPIALVLVAAMVVAACVAPLADQSPDRGSTLPTDSVAPTDTLPSPGQTAAPTPSAAATPVPAESPTPTPAASPPASLPRSAVVEQDGVRVRIALERNPMPAGEWTRVKVTVRNIGRRDLTWFHDGCATLLLLQGEMAGEWRQGIGQSGVAHTFKDNVLDISYNEDPPRSPRIQFVPERYATGSQYGCADIGMADVIPPGEAIRQEFVWGGMAHPHWGMPRSGPIRLTGRFGYYWRGRNEPENILDRTIGIEIDAWITDGVDESWLSPPEVVDAALADPDFAAFLETQDLGNGREEVLWYRPELGAWEVGVLIWYERPDPHLHLVIVDPHSGAILDTVERRWNRKRDGFP
jgi:hypothetical protein